MACHQLERPLEIARALLAVDQQVGRNCRAHCAGGRWVTAFGLTHPTAGAHSDRIEALPVRRGAGLLDPIPVSTLLRLVDAILLALPCMMSSRSSPKSAPGYRCGAGVAKSAPNRR
jgi:hypothetical protein